MEIVEEENKIESIEEEKGYYLLGYKYQTRKMLIRLKAIRKKKVINIHKK